MPLIGKLRRIADPTQSRKTWVWYSPVFTYGKPSQTKKFYEILLRMFSGSVTLQYRLNSESTSWITLPAGDPIPAGNRKGLTIQLLVTGLTSSSAIRSITILYRLLVGERAPNVGGGP